jgi:hypothetical protein
MGSLLHRHSLSTLSITGIDRHHICSHSAESLIPNRSLVNMKRNAEKYCICIINEASSRLDFLLSCDELDHLTFLVPYRRRSYVCHFEGVFPDGRTEVRT